MTAKMARVVFDCDTGPIEVKVVLQGSGVKWASRKDMIILCQYYGMDVTVPRPLIAEQCAMADSDAHVTFREFGIKPEGTTSSAVYVREVAWDAMLRLHHVALDMAEQVLLKLGQAKFEEVEPPAAQFVTKSAFKAHQEECYRSEDRLHARIEKLERILSTSRSTVEQPIDLAHLKKVLSEGWALLKKAENGKASS